MSRRPIRTKSASARRLVGVVGAALVFGCGATAGESSEFAAAVRPVVNPAAGASPRAFVNAQGWAIELERAEVVLGPIYLHGPEPEALAWMPSLVSVAYAHPADAAYDGGPPLGDILEQRLIDLTEEEPTSLGRVFGLKGQLDTLEVQVHPPTFATRGAALTGFARLGDASFSLEGTARKDRYGSPIRGGGNPQRSARRAVSQQHRGRRRAPGRE